MLVALGPKHRQVLFSSNLRLGAAALQAATNLRSVRNLFIQQRLQTAQASKPYQDINCLNLRLKAQPALAPAQRPQAAAANHPIKNYGDAPSPRRKEHPKRVETIRNLQEMSLSIARFDPNIGERPKWNETKNIVRTAIKPAIHRAAPKPIEERPDEKEQDHE